MLVHDNAYADLGFDGYQPPSILQADGAKEVAVELYSMTKSFSMAGWRVAFLVGNAEVVAALAKLKRYLDYGTFQPIQIAATVTLNEAPDFPKEVNEIYQSRRDTLCDGLDRIGWEVEPPKGTMFAWAPIPEPYCRAWARSSSLDAGAGGPRGRSRPASASAPAATATCASPSSRTSSASPRRVRNLRRALTEAGLSCRPRRRQLPAKPPTADRTRTSSATSRGLALVLRR